MSNPHPDRPIAVPKRRLNRTTSNTSVGSTGSQSAAGHSSPLAGFSFGNTAGPISAAKPPLQPSNFSTGFGSPSISNFGNTNTNPSSGFGNAMNTPPITSSAAPAMSGFGGFGNPPVQTTPSTSFSGFGNTNVSSPMGGFGNANAPTAVSPGFSNNAFSGFGQPPQQAKITEIDDEANMDSEESEKKTTTPVTFSGFGAPKEPVKAPAAFSFGTPSAAPATSSSESTKSVFSGFSFGTPASKSTESEKPSTPSFGGFGTSKPIEEADKSNKELSTTTTSGIPAPAFSFSTPKSTVDTSAKTSDAPSPFAGFGKPTTTSSPFAGFGTPVTKTTEDKATEPKKTTDIPSPFSPFGTPAKSTGFSFSTPAAAKATSSDKETDESIDNTDTFSIHSPSDSPSPKPSDKPSPKPSDKPSPFGFAQSSAFGTSTSTEKPSPFGSIKPADESSEDTTKDNAEDKSKDTSDNNAGDDSSDDSGEKPKDAATDKPSPFAAFGSSKPVTEKSTESQLSVNATPFTPGASSTSKESTSAFGSSGKTTAQESAEKDDTEKEDSSKRVSISSVGSNKSSVSSAPLSFSFTKRTSESDKATAAPSLGSFGQSTPASSSEATKPTFAFTTPSKSSTTDKPAPSFWFGTPSSTSNTEKPATSSPFSFSKSSEAPATKPSFSFNPPSADKPTPFSFNIPSTGSSAPSNKKRQLDRDDDEDRPSASKKTFTPGKPTPSPFGGDKPVTFNFGTPSSTTKNDTASKPPVFTFGAPANKEKEVSSTGTKAPTFTFGAPANKEKESPSTSAKAPTFTFGAPANKEKEAPLSGLKVPTFTFGAPPSATPAATTTTEKEATNKPFSFGTPATTAVPEKKNFSFGTPPSLESSTSEATPKTTAVTISKPTISFGTAPSASSDKSKDSENTEKNTPATESEKSSTLGKSPLSQSSTPSDPSPFSTTKDSSKDKDASKKVTFSLSNPPASEAPGSASLAFSKVGNAEANTSSILNLSAPKKNASLSERPTVPTTLKSDVTEPNQITYQTRFWELPDDARNELALLAHFISEQTDKHDKIAEEINSSFGPTLYEMNVKASTLNTDATILKQQLEVQSELLDELIIKNKQQRLNAVSASTVQKQDTKNWRIQGAADNWAFYINTIESMEQRLKQFKLATEQIEEAIIGLERDVHHTPESIGTALENQRKMYMVLAGRVAELHQQADRVVKRRKLN